MLTSLLVSSIIIPVERMVAEGHGQRGLEPASVFHGLPVQRIDQTDDLILYQLELSQGVGFILKCEELHKSGQEVLNA